MPISGTSTNYTGRTKDISIFKGVNPDGSATICPSFGKISQYCSGIQKLIQRYGICLLTAIGSQPNYPTFGTNLITSLVGSNYVYNKADIFPIFNFANMSVIALFRSYQSSTPGLPRDEQLSTAILNSISIDTATLTIGLNIQIFPVAGSPVVFLLPLPLT